MENVVHLRCRHCGTPLKNSPWPYCKPCNIALCYKAMPILLGMMMTRKPGTPLVPVPAPANSVESHNRWKRYPHLRYIMD